MSGRVPPVALADFRVRVLQECLTAALPSVWERRAAAWEDARPRVTDFNGRATRDELVDRDVRCRQIAMACRNHAQLLRETDATEVEVDIARDLREAA